MPPERKLPDMIITSHGDRWTLPVGLEAVRADWRQLWLMAAINRWIREGILQEEIEQRVVRLLRRKPQKLTGTVTPAQMIAIQNEARPAGQNPLIFQGTFLDSQGKVVSFDAEGGWEVRPPDPEPELPKEVQDNTVPSSPCQISFWEDL